MRAIAIRSLVQAADGSVEVGFTSGTSLPLAAAETGSINFPNMAAFTDSIAEAANAFTSTEQMVNFCLAVAAARGGSIQDPNTIVGTELRIDPENVQPLRVL